MNGKSEKLMYCKTLSVLLFALPVIVILHLVKVVTISLDIVVVILGIESFLSMILLLFLCVVDKGARKGRGEEQSEEGLQKKGVFEREPMHYEMISVDNMEEDDGYQYRVSGKNGTKFYSLDVDVDESLPKKVLIVDDSITTLKLLSAYLKKMNVDASMAKSGEEAIEAVRRERYALILMDHMMRGRDGLNTVKEIRQLKDDYYRHVPIVDVLPIGMEQQDVSLDQEYYQAYLIKPIDYEMLTQVMSTYGLYSEE